VQHGHVSIRKWSASSHRLCNAKPREHGSLARQAGQVCLDKTRLFILTGYFYSSNKTQIGSGHHYKRGQFMGQRAAAELLRNDTGNMQPTDVLLPAFAAGQLRPCVIADGR